MGLRIVTSDRTEFLLDRLAGTLRDPHADPLRAETIVVQSKGMEKWLCHRLAERFGSWARGDFPFPGPFIDRISRALLGNPGTDDPFGKEVLAWRVLGQLADGGLSRFPLLRGYLPADGNVAPSLAAYQLARKIADTFDQYAVYRPDLLRDWAAGKGEGGWQAHLWRLLLRGREDTDPVSRRDRLFERMRALSALPEGVPSRVCLFGIPVLPGYHLDFFLHLSRVADVRLFLFNPCRQYWHEIRNRKAAGMAIEGEEWERLHYEEGNRILASLGRHGQGFHRMLLSDRAGDAEEETDEGGPPPGETPSLLRRVQQDIVSLTDRWGGKDGE